MEMEFLMTTVFISLGANLGDAVGTINAALLRLETFSAGPILKSSLWRTSPVDCPPDSPTFINAAAGMFVADNETPESLLAKLQALEKEFGRGTKKIINEARPLDLDLIAFGGETRHSAGLVLPHPRAHIRRFVLQPLSEIAPDLVLPGQILSVRELLKTLPQDTSICRVEL
jgi:2-amino-4-hydroxy-6-hydroxymethyldihydropteridine diphosphokinase